MWLFVFLLVMYFTVGSFESDEMDIYYHKKEFWSHHPAYSINKLVTYMVSKNMKLAIFFTWIASCMLFLSLFNRFFSYTHLAIRLILFPLAAITWSYIPTLILGW